MMGSSVRPALPVLLALMLVLPVVLGAAEGDVDVIELGGSLSADDGAALLRSMRPGLTVRVVPGGGRLLVSGEEEDLAWARRVLNRLDRPARQYRVRLELRRTTVDVDAMRRLGVTFTGGGGPLVRLGRRRDATVRLADLVGGGRSRAAQTLSLREGARASVFVGDDVPFVAASTVAGGTVTNVRTLSAGRRLVIRAIRPSGDDAVEIGLSFEDTAVISTSAGPATSGLRSETVLAVPLGRAVVLCSLEGSRSSRVTERGGGLNVTITETRRDRSWPFRSRRIRRSPLAGDLASGHRDVGGGSSLVVLLRVEEIEGPSHRDRRKIGEGTDGP